ncbi:MAG: hypothetical protein Q8M24_18575 [Pseudolabrys sp.]|nr:hypothetical protein [Pseudolabrys sp.]MDP2297452.1 hypothetical protein [Pseudolabrys sp.]
MAKVEKDKNPRRRKAGAGRKPKGPYAGKMATFATRITDETRKDLELAAAAKRRSLSQEAECRLRVSFQRERAAASDPQMTALCFVISQIASHMQPQGEEPRWRTDPKIYEGFFAGVSLLLAAMHPAQSAADLEGADEARAKGEGVASGLYALAMNPEMAALLSASLEDTESPHASNFVKVQQEMMRAFTRDIPLRTPDALKAAVLRLRNQRMAEILMVPPEPKASS